MKGPYDDIIGLSYPIPTSRKRMSMTDRAAQFSPFAALTGYDAAIRETGRLTDRQIDLDVDGEAMLDEKIRQLARYQEEQPEITVTWFVPDARKCGGAYVSVTGRVKKIDRNEQAMVLVDGTVICFSQISDLNGEIFQQRYHEELPCNTEQDGI